MFDKIKSIFYKEQWPDDKNLRFVFSVKGNKKDKDTVIYLNEHQLNVIVGMINLGSQIIQSPMLIATIEPKTTQEFIQ